jgi:AraC family transcriptional activator of pobA
MKHYKNLSALSRDNGFAPPENPLLNLIRCNKTCTIGDKAFTGDFYLIGFKKLRSGLFKYGRTNYDHDNGSMSFIKPRQVIELKDLEFEEDGFLIIFHEDFLIGNPLFADIKKYGYFEYETNEALHLSPNEERIIWELFNKIKTEYNNNQDEYSKDIMLGHIDSIFKYAQRFYKRQFINRTTQSGTIVTKFNDLLSQYIDKGLLSEMGLPTVKSMAAALNLSPNYLGDLLKQETGKTALELIHIFLISEAKNLLQGSDNNIAETAYALGFDHLPYFSRLFKKEVGISPFQFRKKQLLN